MEVIYKKTIVDKIQEARQKAVGKCKEIEFIVLTRTELSEVYDHLEVQRCSPFSRRGCPLHAYLFKRPKELLDFTLYGIRIVAQDQQDEEF